VRGDTGAGSVSSGGIDGRGLGVVGVVLDTTERVDAVGGGTGVGVASGARGCRTTATTTTAISPMSSSGHHLNVRPAELPARVRRRPRLRRTRAAAVPASVTAVGVSRSPHAAIIHPRNRGGHFSSHPSGVPRPRSARHTNSSAYLRVVVVAAAGLQDRESACQLPPVPACVLHRRLA